MTAALVALVVVVGTGFGLWSAFWPGMQAPASPGARGYFITFPEHAGALGQDPNGGIGVTITIRTNLPEGTLVDIDAPNIGGPGGIGECCPPVHQGRLTIAVDNASCYLAPGSPRSTGFGVTITVKPDFKVVPIGPVAPGSTRKPIGKQPATVLAILGQRFERLKGDQVRTVNGVRQLVASATFAWPSNTCEALLRSNDGFLPQVCPTTDTTGHSLAMIQAPDPRGLMDQLMPAIAQIRLCEVWSQWMVPAYRQSNPWLAFRDRAKAWIDSLGGLAGDQPDQFTALTWKFRSEGPKAYAADIILRGTPVAHVEFVSLPFPTSCGTGCEPFWGFTKLDLIER